MIQTLYKNHLSYITVDLELTDEFIETLKKIY